jgi:hypothetical protein
VSTFHSTQDFTYSTKPCIVLNFQGRQDLLENVENDVDMTDLDASNWIDEDELDPTLAAAPPGEEGFFISHAGGEFITPTALHRLPSRTVRRPKIHHTLRVLTNLTGSVTISVHGKIELNAKCTNGSRNSLISWMPIFNTRLTDQGSVKRICLGNGIFRSLTSQVRSLQFHF